jgi:hypothetical protein
MNADPPPELRLLDMLRALTGAGVDFVVVGGVAVVLQASPRVTADLDISPAPNRENLQRLGEVLRALRARLRGIDEDVPFVPDSRALAQLAMVTLVTDAGNLDLLMHPDGPTGYAGLRRRADRMDIDGVVVRVASVEDLMAMKRTAGRPQDEADLESLEVARMRRSRREPATRRSGNAEAVRTVTPKRPRSGR